MKPLVSRFIIFGILTAAPLALSAQQANPPAHRAEAEISGFSLGGPVGVLDDQQRTSYLAAMKKEHGRLAELQAKMLAARQDLLVTSVTEKFDENVIRQKALVAARFEAEMAVIRAKVFSEVQPPLTAEQIERIKSGQSGPIRPLGKQQIGRVPRPAPSAGTNQDLSGLPPKK